MKTMGAAKAKAQFLALLDEVEMKRIPVLVTKNGKPVAKLMPLELSPETDPLDRFYFGKGKIIGDITAPIYSDEEWEEFFQASAEQFK
jgi:prevent-host-death family protein